MKSKLEQLQERCSGRPHVIDDGDGTPWGLIKWYAAGEPYVWIPAHAVDSDLKAEVWMDIGLGKMALFINGLLDSVASSDMLVSQDKKIVVLGKSYGYSQAGVFTKQGTCYVKGD